MLVWLGSMVCTCCRPHPTEWTETSTHMYTQAVFGAWKPEHTAVQRTDPWGLATRTTCTFLDLMQSPGLHGVGPQVGVKLHRSVEHNQASCYTQSRHSGRHGRHLASSPDGEFDPVCGETKESAGGLRTWGGCSLCSFVEVHALAVQSREQDRTQVSLPEAGHDGDNQLVPVLCPLRNHHGCRDICPTGDPNLREWKKERDDDAKSQNTCSMLSVL